MIYTSTMEITKHVRRKSLVSESLANGVDVSTMGLNIVPSCMQKNDWIMERLNSVSRTSEF